MHNTGGSGLVHWDDPEGWEGMGWDGMGWRIHVDVWQNQYNTVK